MSATLYELADLKQIIDRALEVSEGELTDDIASALDAWEEAFPAKVQNIALYIKDLEGDAAKVKAEEERLAAKRASYLNRAKWLTSYVQTQMERTGLDSAGGPLARMVLQNNPPRVEPVTVLDEPELRNIASFAPQFVRHEESWALDKKSILEAHKSGTLPEDLARRVKITQSRSVRIR